MLNCPHMALFPPGLKGWQVLCGAFMDRARNALALAAAGQVELVATIAPIGPEREAGGRCGCFGALPFGKPPLAGADAKPGSHERLAAFPAAHDFQQLFHVGDRGELANAVAQIEHVGTIREGFEDVVRPVL